MEPKPKSVGFVALFLRKAVPFLLAGTHTKRQHPSVITFVASGEKNPSYTKAMDRQISVSNTVANPVLDVKFELPGPNLLPGRLLRTMQSEDENNLLFHKDQKVLALKEQHPSEMQLTCFLLPTYKH